MSWFWRGFFSIFDIFPEVKMPFNENGKLPSEEFLDFKEEPISASKTSLEYDWNINAKKWECYY